MRHISNWKDFQKINEGEKNHTSSAIGSILKQSLSTFLGESPIEGEITIGEEITGDKKQNILAILEAMKRHGITNPYTKKAILGVIGKESGFVPQNEIGYGNTDNQRIRSIFGDRVRKLSDDELSKIKKDNVEFFDLVYGKKAEKKIGFKTENDQPGDGYKYRARGFNGITFKSNYKRYQGLMDKIGKLENKPNIVDNPDLLNSDPNVAAEVAIIYFLDAAQSPKMKEKYGTNDLNSFKDQETAIKAITNLNAGISKDITKDPLDSVALATKQANQFSVGDIKAA